MQAGPLAGLALLRLIAWRALTADRTRTLLTALGVALGVAAFLAVRLANDAVLASFSHSLDSVAGKSRLTVTGGEPGLDESVFPVVAQTFGVAHAVPIVQAITPVVGHPGEALLVLGVDVLGDADVRQYEATGIDDPLRLLTEPDAILLTERYAAERGLARGDTIRLATPTGPKAFTVRGLLTDAGAARFMEGRTAVLDIAAAQLALDRVGRLDRIDLVLTPGADADAIAAALRPRLPPAYRVERPESRNAQVEQMLASFQLNLFVLSLVALFVGAFLVYNTMAVSVVRQRRQLATLRALGAGRGAVLALVTTEGLLIGLVGALAGVALGLGLTRLTLDAVSRTVSSLYAFVRPAPPDASIALLLCAGALGCAVAMASALLPAWEAASVPPRAGFVASTLERRHRPWLLSLAGLGLAALAGLLAQLRPVDGRPLFGYAAALSLLVAATLLCPLGLLAVQRLLSPLLRRPAWLTSGLAARNLGRARRRMAVTLGAMVVGLALLVSVSTMVQSFRRTVQVWIDQTIRADLYVSRDSRLVRGADLRLPAATLDVVRRTPGVAAADGVRALRLADEHGVFTLVAGDLDLLARRGGLLVKGGRADATLERARSRGGVLVSETFAERRGIRAGAAVALSTPGGGVALPVAGVYFDYTTEGGVVLMDRLLFARLWTDPWLTGIAVYLSPGVGAEAVRASLARGLGRADLLLLSNRDLRGRVLEIFDQTFAITYALELIALVVATLGVLNSLIAAVLERTREIGILRAMGFSRPRIVRMIVWEAGFLGVLAAALGIAAGLALSVILVYVINKQSFGWTIQFAFPLGLLAEYGLLTLAASVLAGLLPAWRGSQVPIARAVRYE